MSDDGGGGQVKLSLLYSSEESRLVITVYACRYCKSLHAPDIIHLPMCFSSLAV